MFGVGVWLSFTQAEFSSLPLSFPSLSAANLLLVAGGITMVTGFLGCLGALKEQRCLLFMVRDPYDRKVADTLFFFLVGNILGLFYAKWNDMQQSYSKMNWAAFQFVF